MPRVADSSVLCAVFSPQDAHYAKAKSALSDPGPMMVPPEIFGETVHLIESRHGFEAALAAFGLLLSRPHVRVAEPVGMTAVRGVFAAAAGRLSLADSIVVQTYRALGLPPLTYDDEIARAAR